MLLLCYCETLDHRWGNEMDRKTFIENKLALLKKDDTKGLGVLAEPLSKAYFDDKTVKVNADGNWFEVTFDAVQVKEDRAVISAHRIYDGMVPGRFDPSLREFRIEFQGTRAAYLFGEYHNHHPIGCWPYISWDVRAYANNPLNSKMRVYVSGFRAQNEIRRLITFMQSFYGTKNIINSYINDNLQRFKMGIAAKKTVDQIEKEWSQGMMERLGYQYVEASGSPKGTWINVKVHWFKDMKDAFNG